MFDPVVESAATHCKRALRCILAAALLCALTVTRAAEVSPYDEIAYADEAAGLKFPQMMATYRFQQKLDSGNTAQGFSLVYVENTGATATITFYDAGQLDVAEGINDPRVREELRKIDASTKDLVQKGKYKSAKRMDKLAPLSKEWLQVNHEILLPGGKTVHHYNLVRGYHGKFLRVEVYGAPEGTYARLHPFLLSVMRATGLMIPGYRPPGVVR